MNRRGQHSMSPCVCDNCVLTRLPLVGSDIKVCTWSYILIKIVLNLVWRVFKWEKICSTQLVENDRLNNSSAPCSEEDRSLLVATTTCTLLSLKRITTATLLFSLPSCSTVLCTRPHQYIHGPCSNRAQFCFSPSAIH